MGEQDTAQGEPGPGAQTLKAGNIPAPSFGALILLQKIDSPFTRIPRGADGRPAVDAQGRPTAEAVPIVPGLEDIARSLYIVMHQEDLSALRKLIENREAFDEAVMNMASQIAVPDMMQIASLIGGRMKDGDASQAAEASAKSDSAGT